MLMRSRNLLVGEENFKEKAKESRGIYHCEFFGLQTQKSERDARKRASKELASVGQFLQMQR
jgi:hypothetical protein